MSEKSNISVNVDIGAKAELKAEMPSDATGRLLDALTDLIRPISERRGLRADKLRLQREDVLIQITRKARERLAIERDPIDPIPAKFLVPLLEKASLEDPDDEFMVGMWAQLMASAAISKSARNNRFISIMEEINGRQAKLLNDIISDGYTPGSIKLGQIHDGIFYINQSGIQSEIDNIADSDIQAFGEALLTLIDTAGVAIDVIQITDKENESFDFMPEGRLYSDKRQLDFEILDSLYLIKKVEIKNLQSKRRYPGREYTIDAFYYVVTYLALALFDACNPGWFAHEEL